MHISRRLAERVDEFAESIAREGGKPLKWAKVEATRAVSTFRWAAEEAPARRTASSSAWTPRPRSASRAGLIRRFPYGPVLGITPFNFPREPGGAQGRARRSRSARRSSSSRRRRRRSASLPPGRAVRRDGPAARACSRCCRSPEGRATGAGSRTERFRKLSFTGSSGIGWYLKGLDPQQARDARARRQRRRDRALGRRPGPARRSGSRSAATTRRGSLHQRAARAGPVRGLRGLRGAAGEAGREPEGRRPDGPDGRRRPGDRRRARSSGSTSGCRRRSRRAPRS